MASYVVMEPPSRGPDDQAVIVRDGFHVFAFLAPFLWLLWHRLWIEAAIALVVAMAFGALGSVAGLGATGAALSLLVSIYVGVEGPALKLAALRRRGWRDWGAVEADGREDAEIRYLAEAYGREPSEDTGGTERAAAPISVSNTAYDTGRSGPALGLFSYPGNR
ncbi:DUF2628 domain-containing protein [Aquamicrobium sp. LC103]|uniref:DUF2628 domain-containing protein n=1 Tax=Aquamicrobium sp. LC103 TaxID=1120658 RepID=UPI00063E90D2|nr:DUF2628 domain-containing protein [Aquamicrobium sp. LC103]TKT82790.1 DUF2628 domain-containing protein [Aquamicrobium sp. LC103]